MRVKGSAPPVPDTQFSKRLSRAWVKSCFQFPGMNLERLQCGRRVTPGVHHHNSEQVQAPHPLQIPVTN